MEQGKGVDPQEEVKARILRSVKRDARAVFKHYNLSTNQAINLFFHEVAETKSLSFNLKMPNKETIQAIEEVKTNVAVKSFKNAQEMLDDLHSDNLKE